jgi:positive regulator of sigma E activity
MSEANQYIEQIGLVKSTEGGRVKIVLSESGCSACHNSLCMLGESKAKELDVMLKGQSFKIGEEVVVKINPSSGHKAVAILYILPFLLMVGFMWLAIRVGYNEGIAGLSAILILLPYFGLVYMLRKSLGSQCTIDVTTR